MQERTVVEDVQLRIEALVQARHAVAGQTVQEMREAAEVFYAFLKGPGPALVARKPRSSSSGVF